jgi:hypothetical protein
LISAVASAYPDCTTYWIIFYRELSTDVVHDLVVGPIPVRSKLATTVLVKKKAISLAEYFYLVIVHIAH